MRNHQDRLHCCRDANLPGNPPWHAFSLSGALSRRSLHTLCLRQCSRLQLGDVASLEPRPASALTKLSFCGCQNIDLTVLDALPSLHKLRSLSLCGLYTGPAWHCPNALSALTALTELRLARQPVRDEHVERAIAGCTALQALDLSGTAIGEDAAQHLTALSSLTSLDLSWTHARWPPPLHGLRSLAMDACVLGGDWAFAYTLQRSVQHGTLQPLTCLERLSLLEVGFDVDVRPGCCCLA